MFTLVHKSTLEIDHKGLNYKFFKSGNEIS